MGFAIAGMHYTGMAAMHLIPDPAGMVVDPAALLATDGLAAAVVVATIVILGIALSGSNVERALTKKTFQNETLQASLASRDEFFSVASHELKTPLTSLKLQNELLMRSIERDGMDTQKILAMLAKNGKSIGRLNRLVDDMLDTSRVSTGKLNLQKEHCDLSSLVSDVLARFKPILEEAGCQVTFLRAKTIEGLWDRFRLEQVVTNLLTNAAKYAPGKPVMIKVDATDHTGIISVKDFGKGITEEDQHKIFNRFERAQREGDMKGLGLGLFISKEIIEMHHGSIEVFSRIGEGSEFIVKLPAEENQL
jgi:signal transduction histidine kinase